MENLKLMQELKSLEDNRRKQGQRHSIEVSLMIVIMATMSGFIGYRAIGDFINRYKRELLEYLKPKKDRLPSFPTVRRILMSVDTDEFRKIFDKWAMGYLELKDGEWISIDGKAIKGTKQNNEDKKLAHLVSFFRSDSKEVIIAKKTFSKSNEIPLVQDMLREFPLKNLIFTIDAMHCQSETLKIIKDSENDYVVQVKKNQKKTI
jgi:hypothetical protein